MSAIEFHVRGEDLGSVEVEMTWQGTTEQADGIDLQISDDDLEQVRWLQEASEVVLYSQGEGRRGVAEAAVTRIGAVLKRALSSTEGMRKLLDRALSPGPQRPMLWIRADTDAVLALPWELTLSPADTYLATTLGGIARIYGGAGVAASAERTQPGKLRLLLVISRPAAEDDVPYRAIAARLLDRLEKRAEITVVRPGSFRAFERFIADGRYDIVHYDGHGNAGSLAFEDGIIEASRIGAVLAASQIPLFVLNACRSAVTEGSPTSEARRFASVAHELLHSGARGVVAMGASVRVYSAEIYMDRLYEELINGSSVAAACHIARRAVEAGDSYGPLDWAIPVLYLREDFIPVPGETGERPSALDILQTPVQVKADDSGRSKQLFIGRDGDLYKVDRAVDENERVLVFGVAGIGKTTLMEHLLHWRARTGGAGRLLNFSFKAGPSLETLAQAFEHAVAEVHPETGPTFTQPQWQVTPTSEKLTKLGMVLANEQKEFWLVLLDNLETLAGYPEAGAGPYTDEDRQIFRMMLASLEGQSCRVIMTARRDEVGLVGDRTRRFQLSGVAESHRLEMLRAYAECFASDGAVKSALSSDDGRQPLEALLRLLGGHPLATRVAAYGLRDRTIAQVEESVRGESEAIVVPASEADTRSESLEAVLQSIMGAISVDRRRAIGLLGLFRGRFHQMHLFEMVGQESFPEGVVEDRSEGFLVDVLREAQAVGVMAGSQAITGVWEAVPGSQGALDQLWRSGLDTELLEAVERHFVAYWAGQANLYFQAFSNRDLAQQAVLFTLTEEGSLQRALELAGSFEQWGEVDLLVRLLLTVLPMVGRIKDADHLRDTWVQRVSDTDGSPKAPDDEALVNLWRLLMGVLADRLSDSGDLDGGWAVHRRIVDALEAAPETDKKNLSIGYHQLGNVELQRGRLDEAEEWSRKSLAIKEELGDRLSIAKTYHHLGIIEQMRGRLDEAEEWNHKSLAIFTEVGDRPSIAGIYHQLGIIEQRRGRLDEAEDLCRKSLAIKEELGDRPSIAGIYHELGSIELQRGRLDEAEDLCRKSLAIKEELGDRPGIASSYHHLGIIEQQRGRLDEAEDWYRKSLGILTELGDRPSISKSYHQLGIIELQRGRLDEAEDLCRKSLAIKEELGDRPGVTSSYHQIGIIEQIRGRLDEAEDWYRKSLAILTELGDRPNIAKSYHQLGIIEQECGRFDEAEDLCRKSLVIKEELGDRPGIALSYHQLGIVEQGRGRLDEAEDWCHKGLAIEEELGNRPGIASGYHQLGKLKEKRDQHESALKLYLVSLSLFAELKLPEGGVVFASLRRLAAAMGRDAFLTGCQDAGIDQEMAELFLKVPEDEAESEDAPESKEAKNGATLLTQRIT